MLIQNSGISNLLEGFREIQIVLAAETSLKKIGDITFFSRSRLGDVAHVARYDLN